MGAKVEDHFQLMKAANQKRQAQIDSASKAEKEERDRVEALDLALRQFPQRLKQFADKYNVQAKSNDAPTVWVIVKNEDDFKDPPWEDRREKVALLAQLFCLTGVINFYRALIQNSKLHIYVGHTHLCMDPMLNEEQLQVDLKELLQLLARHILNQ